MSKVIDERVVSMQFDNRHFESNVQTTMSTLDKLKAKLKFTDAGKGFENINTSAARCNLSPLSNAVDSVGIKFNAMYTIADQALRNITNSAMNYGKRIVSALTIDPVKSGFSEYETQINSVQTILANTESKGSTLNDVNAALDELNTYADKTIYNFTEMTRNIGTFTAAGVELDTAVSSIKGIANLAAVSGSTSQQASTAMYQLSQALAAGKVSLMDWNSVVNAGMGGQVFQDALKRTSEMLGTGAEAAIKQYGSFRESLTKGQWLTTEVLTETLNQLSGAYSEADLIAQGFTKEQAAEITKLAQTATDAATKVKTATQLWDTLKEAAQSGWTQTWEILVGDFGEAKELWTTVSDTVGAMIGESANKRNTLLSSVMDTNWEKFISSINKAGMETADFEAKVKSLAEEKGIDLSALIKKYGSFEEVFRSGAASSDLLREAVSGVNGVSTELIDVIGELGGRELIIESLASIFRTLSLVISPAKEAIDEIFTVDPKGLFNLIESFHGLTGKVETFFTNALGSKWDRFISSVNDAGMSTEDLEAKVTALAKSKGIDLSVLIEKYGSFEEVFRSGAASSDLLREAIKGVADSSGIFLKTIDELSGKELLVKSFINIFEGLKSVITPIKEAFADVFDIKLHFQSRDLYALIESFHAFTEKLKLNATQSEQLKTIFKGLFSVVRMGIDFIGEIISGVFNLGKSFSELDIISTFGNNILEIGSSLGDYLINLRNTAKETGIFGIAVNKVVGVIKNIIGYIKELAGAISMRFDMFSFEGFSTLLTGIWNVVTKVGGAIAEAGRYIAQGLLNIFRTGDLAAGFDILNSGLLATILLGVKKFVDSLTDTIDVKGGFIESLKSLRDGLLDTFGSIQEKLKSEALMNIAKAIAILAVSVLVLALIDPAKMTASLAAIGGLLYGLTSAMKVMNSLGNTPKGMVKMAAMLTAISVAVLIMAAAMRVIGGMGWGELAKGLVGVLGLTAILVAAGKLMSSNSKKVIKGAGQMVVMAAALLILTSVCKKMGDLNWEQLAKGVVGIGTILLEFVGFQALMSLIKPKKMLTSATSLVIMAAAMEIFVDVCRKFSTMNWEEFAKAGAAIGGILLLAAGFALLSGLSKKMTGSSVALVIIAASMEIFADVCDKFGQLKWEELGKAGAAIAGVLLLAAGFALLSGMSKKMAGSVISLTIMAAAMEIFADVCQKFTTMNWEELGKAGAAIGGILLLAAGFALLSGLAGGMLASSAALLIMATSLSILTPVLTTLGSMTWGEIVKGFIAIAGAFVIIGAAGLLLSPVIPAILGLSAALALFGVACAAIGAGVILFSAGLTALATAGAAGATAIVASIGVIITGLLGLIPAILQLLGDMITTFCLAIVEAAPALGKAVKALVLTLIDVLVECVPALVDGALKLLIGIMEGLVEYGPQLIDLLFDFIISVLDGLAERIPELVQSAVKLMASFFSAIIEALKSMDTTTLINAIAGVGLVSAFIVALGLLAPLIPSAMLGVLGVGGIIAEIAVVLAAIGALAQIPGLDWLINESGDFLKSIGNAIGGFIGGFIGGALEGITDSLPDIASNLSQFMLNLMPFIVGAKTIDSTMLEGVENIAGIVLTLTKASIIEGLTSWFTGGSSLANFADQLIPFGESLVNFSKTIRELTTDDVAKIKISADAAMALTEMADNVPNMGGLLADFFGENDLSDFGDELILFGKSLAGYAKSIRGLTQEDIDSIKLSADGAAALADMADKIPNSGGWLGAIAGENSLTAFSDDLEGFGSTILTYAKSVTGLNDSHVQYITKSGDAVEALAKVAKKVPNEGGLLGAIAGENNVTEFAIGMTALGKCIKDYANAVVGIDDTTVDTIKTSKDAVEAMASVAKQVPNEGGLAGLLAGDENLSGFTSSMIALGNCINSYVSVISGIDDTKIDAIKMSKTAVAEMTATAKALPNEGGLAGLLAGENNNVTGFAATMSILGECINSYVSIISGIDDTKIDAIKMSKTAVTEMAAAAKALPNEGGLAGLLAGENTNATGFAANMVALGNCINSYVSIISGIDDTKIDAIKLSKTAIAEMTAAAKALPNEGGVAGFFAGENTDATSFVNNMIALGKCIISYVSVISGIDDTKIDSIKNSKDAVEQMAKVVKQVPKLGEDNIANVSTLSSSMPTLGNAIRNYATNVSSIGEDNVKAAKQTVKVVDEFKTAVKKLSDIKLENNRTKVDSAIATIKKILSFATDVKSSDSNGLSSLADNLKSAAKDGVDAFIKAFTDSHASVRQAGRNLVMKFADGIPDRTYYVKQKIADLLTDVNTALSGGTTSAYNSGKNIATSFANGIADYSYKAINQANSLATSVTNIVNKALGINSPSKVFTGIGGYVVEGFANGIQNGVSTVRSASEDMAKTSCDAVNGAISILGSIASIDLGIECEPVIAPVVDMTNVESSANAMTALFGSINPTASIAAEVSGISANMNAMERNGGSDDIVSAINKLSEKLENLETGDTYSINGITYDDGSNIANAMNSIVRACRLQGRS